VTARPVWYTKAAASPSQCLFADQHGQRHASECVDRPWARYVRGPDARGIGTVRYPRLVDSGVMPTELKRRTLTNLYNEMPTWLRNAHAKLDEAVFAAYAATTGDAAWKADIGDEEILEKLLALNRQRQ